MTNTVTILGHQLTKMVTSDYYVFEAGSNSYIGEFNSTILIWDADENTLSEMVLAEHGEDGEYCQRDWKFTCIGKTSKPDQEKVDASKPVIIPINITGDCRQGTLRGLNINEITKRLGFSPNVEDDPDKVEFSWGFTVDDERCGVWDYKGSALTKTFSTFGPIEALRKVFGDYVS